MILADFAKTTRSRIFESIERGLEPPVGAFDQAKFLDGKAKGQPLIGATRYEPDATAFEFIYPDPNGAPVVLSVRVAAPERIVFMPVPAWVVESIWQGEVHGSYCFESEAKVHLAELEDRLSPERNPSEFAEKIAVGRP